VLQSINDLRNLSQTIYLVAPEEVASAISTLVTDAADDMERVIETLRSLVYLNAYKKEFGENATYMQNRDKLWGTAERVIRELGRE